MSYLFGTMHVRDLRAFSWFRTACIFIEECEVFAAEFDFSQADHATLTATWTLPEGIILKQLLSRRAWKNLAFHARKKLGLPAEFFQNTHPMQVQVALTTALLREETSTSLDETLWAYARAKGKSTAGLETFEEQLELLRNMPLDMQVKNLNHFLKNYHNQRALIKRMLRWYQEGDIYQIHRAGRRDARWMRRSLLLERNERMARRFAELAQRQRVFAAVGAAHLAGSKGMLRLIKQAGFSVKPIPQHAP